MLCPTCHTLNRDNAKFCKGCGQSFTAETVGAPLASPTAQGNVQGQSQPESGRAEVQAAAPAQSGGGDFDDPSLAPTQILTPQQMIEYHTRRWQRELEQEQQRQSVDEQQRRAEIAELPTLLFTPPGSGAAQQMSPAQQRDIAEQPTIAMTPGELSAKAPEEAPSTTTGQPAEPASPTATEDAAKAEAGTASPPSTTDAADTNSQGSGEEAPASASAPEEDIMEQIPPSTGDQSNEEQINQPRPESQAAAEDFPVLAVGTVVAERYEVVQVIGQEEDEHVYLVTDHQGYQRCWNCGSEQNAEGDEFCIDCGAELLNASYTMHEYATTASKDSEAHVLQGNIMNTFMDQGRTYVIEQPQATQSAFPTGVHLLAASDSDAGNVRRSDPNEDSTLVLQLQRIHESLATPSGIFIVADGMGGHENGQGASRMTINIIAERMVRELLAAPLSAEKAGETPPAMDEDSLVALLQGAIEDANTALCQMNQREKSDMGSTITGFMVVGDHAYILNVGDSRTYMLRDSKLYQLTNDHSLVGQLVASGLIEPDEVYTHPQRSQIYRSLGDKLNVQIDIFKQQIHPGDILLSCCDGLWEMVRDPQITEILVNAPDPQTACTRLIEAANANGGEDNISVVIVYVR
ncbi:MAG TPA: protein phosphatase 2C domain-containing protein [Ktedonobacteraceae bacterium]|nr:protein phosphatase 2C domain-containing protein [Ktedonobacteraceae bacterium]